MGKRKPTCYSSIVFSLPILSYKHHVTNRSGLTLTLKGEIAHMGGMHRDLTYPGINCFPLRYRPKSFIPLSNHIEKTMMTPSNKKNVPRYCPFVRGIHRSPVGPLHRGQWHGALLFSLMCAWTNGWANNRDAATWDVILLIMTAL